MRSGFVVRQVAQDDGLQRAENGAVGSHAERERQDGDRREPGVAEKRPDRVTKVLQESAHVNRLLRRSGVLKRWLSGEADALGSPHAPEATRVVCPCPMGCGPRCCACGRHGRLRPRADEGTEHPWPVAGRRQGRRGDQGCGYGVADRKTNTPATPETVYKIASVSKQFIATGIMLLVQEGRLGVDDPVKKFIADVPAAWTRITIRHLLTHTSGLVREPPAFSPFRADSDADLIKSAYATPLVFTPGEKWRYLESGLRDARRDHDQGIRPAVEPVHDGEGVPSVRHVRDPHDDD